MRILTLNWRDIRNPKGGGAEILTHEMAKRWVKRGHEVTQFSERFNGSQKEDVVDGVKIIRGGSADVRSFRLPVHAAAYFWYTRQTKASFDVIVDEIHGIPFFTPLYAREKKVALICEVADELWDVSFPFPLNYVGKFIENNYFRFYRNIPFLTISPSTKKELLRMGINERKVTVLPMGLSMPSKILLFPKDKNPTIIFVGRLTKAKGTFDAISVLAILKHSFPNIQLWMLGQGDTETIKKIYELADKLGVRNSLKLFGFVSREKKFELLSSAHILVVPSVKEGWGLTVPEAGLVETPAVAYDTEGLRDVVKHNKTGILTQKNPHDLAGEVNHLLKNRNFYKNLQKGAKKLARAYSWDKTAQVALSILKESTKL